MQTVQQVTDAQTEPVCRALIAFEDAIEARERNRWADEVFDPDLDEEVNATRLALMKEICDLLRTTLAMYVAP